MLWKWVSLSKSRKMVLAARREKKSRVSSTGSTMRRNRRCFLAKPVTTQVSEDKVKKMLTHQVRILTGRLTGMEGAATTAIGERQSKVKHRSQTRPRVLKDTNTKQMAATHPTEA